MYIRAFVAALCLLGPANAAPTAYTGLAARDDQTPTVWPPPQEISLAGNKVSLDGDVTIVTGKAKDEATINAVKAVVTAAGGNAAVSSESTGSGTQIFIGTIGENAAGAAAAKALTGKSADGLDPDGYVLAAGNYEDKPSIVLNGVDDRGTFYAVQTLRQLLDGSQVPGIKVRDWPLMSIRGSIEGFYGVPWSHQARLDQYAFYAKHKMNTYIYTPKDDPLLRSKWRTEYTGEALSELQELVDTANANHVDFTFALSPGLDLCYSSDDDFTATTAKLDQIRDLGVHSFYIALDDIGLEFHCDSDKNKWADTGDSSNIAEAQTYYLNRVQSEWIEANNLDNLETVPTNYAGSSSDPYKKKFGTTLNKNIRVQWTGEGIFSDEITVESVQTADTTYNTDNLFIWDNFPVNDADRDRLFLNPLTGRAAELYKDILGFTTNPMQQSYASMLSLANYADYTWNGPAYNADDSTAAILKELAGNDKKVQDALDAFVDLHQNWPYRNPAVNSPKIDADIKAFWAARKDSSDGAQPLSDRLKLLATVPDVLPGMAMKGFANDVAPWADVVMQWATACQHLITMLEAIDGGDTAKADSEYKSAEEWIEKTKAKTVDDRDSSGTDIPDSIVPAVGGDAFTKFLSDAKAVKDGQ
ncbi:hypothetical protein N7457_003656 [Penicillium paradoxum]|uniref:uncharacterized protein n=1 Tax=Penicillium paradoxum TaxID=176176 RepID=UPI0025493BBD|nr:uncharacterized protein N7457_003656 [Penicillium paradoxum]KAJ5788666.1 hypothetical protein N7457_003656 [Penicillium paradoxum]